MLRALPRHARTPLCALLAGVCAFAGAAPAWAAWGLSPSDGYPVCRAPGVQSWSMAASDGLGGLLIAWSDTRSDTLDIYAQHVTADGVAVWPDSGLLVCGASGDRDEPVIASDGAGGAIVVWRDFRLGPTADLYAQRISAAGTLMWDPQGVLVCGAPEDQSHPVIVSDQGALPGPSGAIVAWEDWRNGVAIYAQRLGPDGVARWAANGLRLSSSYSPQFEPVIVRDGGQRGDPLSGAYVAWSQQGPVDWDIAGQHVGPDGSLLWGLAGASLCSAPGNQLDPALAAGSANGVVAAWEDLRGAWSAVYTQKLDWWGANVFLTDGVSLCPGSAADQTNPAIASDGADGAIVAWDDTRAGDRIYAQRVDATGTMQWGAGGVRACTNNGAQQFPTIAADGEGGAIVAWEDGRWSTGPDVYAQHVDSTGAARWAAPGIPVALVVGAQYQPFMVGGSDTTAIVAWSDQRAGGSDVYAQRIPFVLTLSVDGSHAPTARGLSAAPNPARGAATLMCTIPREARGALALYDVAGRRVRTLASGDLAPGAHRWSWDGRDDSGAACPDGVYFARLALDGRWAAMRSITLRR